MSAFITPKENWTAGVDNPLPSDFNRIEGNTNYLNDELIAEISARVAAILLEASTRASADNVLQGNINTEITNRGDADNYEAGERIAADFNITNTILAGKTVGNETGKIPISNGYMNTNLLATYATNALNAGESDTSIKLIDKGTSGEWQIKYVDGTYCDFYFNGTRIGAVIFS